MCGWERDDDDTYESIVECNDADQFTGHYAARDSKDAYDDDQLTGHEENYGLAQDTKGRQGFASITLDIE
jgi:hypothetical protein